MVGSKLEFLEPAEGQLQVKLAKNLQEVWVWCKTMKSDIFEGILTLFEFRST